MSLGYCLAVIQIACIINKQHEAPALTPELERRQDNVQISHRVGKPQLPQHGSQEVHRGLSETRTNDLCPLLLNITGILCI